MATNLPTASLHGKRQLACVQSANVSQPQKIVATQLPEIDERSRTTVERLIDLILDVLPDVQHERKWGRLTFTQEGDWHHWISMFPALSPRDFLGHKVVAPI
jgi:hypothetical protein